jgi:NTE family protein
MTIAFVLPGGGSLGAVQVGMLQALAERGVQPDLLVGTSSGALNAAWIAGHGYSTESCAELATVWAGVRRSDIFPVDARQIVRGLLGFSSAVASHRKLRDFIEGHAGIQDLAEARVPTHFVAADLLSGRDVLISTGDVTAGVLASAAVPGLLPPVDHDGRELIDGALARRTGIAQAIGLGASVVYVLPSGAACAPSAAPHSAAGVALHSLTLLIEQRLIHEVASLRTDASIRLLPPLCPLAVSPADFSRAPELIDRARQASLRWIDSGGPERPHPEQFLALHDHGRPMSIHGDVRGEVAESAGRATAGATR